MDMEKMGILFDLYQDSNNTIKRNEYETIYRNAFFNPEILIKEADIMIQNYNLKIKNKLKI
ncbi:hypothetical protein LCGC14_0838200 [marine sediment metagenome]|uniref:Uncharacterized protein n=1 Tax=marine sediment metagenome TaxID=412755 RepID=A0A0F9SL58_9ZZZZ